MKVTFHATKRFLERVMHKVRYTQKDVHEAQKYLEEMFGSVVPLSYSHPFALPQHKGFKVIHRDNIVITIIPKKWTK